MKQNVYKCRVTYKDDGTVEVISYANRQIPVALLNELDKVVHTASDKYNGKLSWVKAYIHFEHEGVKYKQIDSLNMCSGCCFYQNDKGCTHPYFGTKPYCTGKIYVIDK